MHMRGLTIGDRLADDLRSDGARLTRDVVDLVRLFGALPVVGWRLEQHWAALAAHPLVHPVPDQPLLLLLSWYRDRDGRSARLADPCVAVPHLREVIANALVYVGESRWHCVVALFDLLLGTHRAFDRPVGSGHVHSQRLKGVLGLPSRNRCFDVVRGCFLLQLQG